MHVFFKRAHALTHTSYKALISHVCKCHSATRTSAGYQLTHDVMCVMCAAASRCPAGYSVRSSSSGWEGGVGVGVRGQTVIAISIIINRDSLPGLTVDS